MIFKFHCSSKLSLFYFNNIQTTNAVQDSGSQTSPSIAIMVCAPITQVAHYDTKMSKSNIYSLKLSLATHMTSSLLDIFVPVPHTIPLPDDKTKAHSQVTVVINGTQHICRGGIVPANTNKILKTGMSQFKTSYMEQLPQQFRTLKPKDTRKQLQHFKWLIPSS